MSIWTEFKRGMDYRQRISGWWLYNILMFMFAAGILVGWMIGLSL